MILSLLLLKAIQQDLRIALAGIFKISPHLKPIDSLPSHANATNCKNENGI